MSSMSATGAPSESATHLGDLGRASISDAPSPSAVSNDLTPAPEATTMQPGLQSQPMTATASTASDQLNILSHDAADASGSYGTRSRNRPGRARPNYADDKEIDLEIEASGKYSKAQKRSAAAPVQQMDVAGLRDGFPTVNGVDGAPVPETAAPLINGSHNVVPNANAPSRKRKQPGSGTVFQAPSPPPTIPHPNPNPIPPSASRAQLIETNMLSFSKSRKRLNKQQQLVADDGTTIQVNDHMYFLCEPPGEPYYFGRIMEFLHVDNDSSAAVEAVRVNWFYRPKDIQRRVQDTRVVFASMHSDTCPLSQMRGKCNIQHLANISDLDEFRKQPDAFWFDKLFDRYMHRYYEVIPTSKVVNVPRRVKKVLDERWKFVLVEVGRGRDLTSASKVCKRCSDFAANHESVDCAVCKNTYHMSCVRPPLLKKPARGFAWACAACSRAQELKMEARHTPMSENELSRLAEAESFDDEDDEAPANGQATPDNSTGADDHPSPTATQLAQANLWLWRYLGIHSKPEDALDYDDRIYPRASSRLGPRHQANVTVWHGRPLEYIKPAEAKKRYKPLVSTKKDHKAAALLENDRRPKRPKWVFDEPPGYVARGHDEPVELKGKREYTAQLTFKMPDPSKFSERGLDDDDRPENYGEVVDAFLIRCDQEIAPLYGLSKGNVDVRTKGLEKLQENNYDVQRAIEAMRKVSAKVDLKLPELSKEEVKRFEEGVALYGSELHAVARYISPTIKESRVVRFYYMWKKTPRGREIWGNYENRKSKKDSKRVEKDANGAKLPDDVGDAADDSAFDNEKAAKVRRGFRCKFCSTTSSRLWRRAPATAPGTLVPRELGSKNAKDKSSWLISALCGKCAYLWRRYAVEYEPIEEIAKKIAISGGRASKRKIDEELMRIVLEAQNFAGDVIPKSTAQIASSAGIDVPLAMVESDEPAKKKVKSDFPLPEIVVEKKKVVPEKPLELEPLKPEMPRVKEHPCAVCHIINHPDHKMLKCRDCRLHVHAPCYGVTMPTGTGPWYCDMCKNDHNTQVSTNYECVLCPVRRTPQELMEPPKVSHKKKTDREREKERAEREMVQEAGRRWREDQLAAGRPVDPREPLKRTAWNNWMHVNCAVWTKEIRFGDAEHLDAAEGLGFIPRERFETACKFCNETAYPVATCQFPSCNNTFHVGCAHQRKLTLGFDITPVKLSRRDSIPVMKLDQESGLAVPGIWCAHHAVPTIVHNMLEPTPSGFTALQEFVRMYKQVDSTVTGTVRRAAQFQANVQPVTNSLQPPYRRTSTMNGHAQQAMQIDVITGRSAQSPSPMSSRVNGDEHGNSSRSTGSETRVKSERKCCTCAIEFSPKWWLIKSGSISEASSVQLHHNTGGHSAPEHGSTRTSSSAQPPSPKLHHQPEPSAVAPITASAPPTAVKPEPIDLDTMDVPTETLDQCHKCHVSKKTPPSSPSQVRRVRHVAEAVQEPSGQATATPPVQQHLTQPPQEGPQHTHPGMHPAGPPPHLYQNGRPPYPGSPPVINGAPPGPHPAVLYGAPPPYHRPGEFGYPYPPPVHYALVGGLPPPSSRANGIPQHSPPPGPYAHPLAGPPPGQPGSPHMASASGPGPYQHRPGGSPTMHYGASRGYGPSHAPQRPPSVTGMSQPPSATEQPTFRPSDGNVNTPRMGMSRPSAVSESPRLAHTDTPVLDLTRDRRSSTTGPGAASASPSLKNLLS